MVQIRLLWSIEEIHSKFCYESAKLIRVTYLMMLPNMRQCEKIQNQTSINKVLKTHVMLLNVSWINDYAYEFISNVASLTIIDSSWLRSQKFDSRNKFIFISVHIMVNKTNCSQGPYVHRSSPITNKIILLSYRCGLVYGRYVSGSGDLK
jgi:hypothetical protein